MDDDEFNFFFVQQDDKDVVEQSTVASSDVVTAPNDDDKPAEEDTVSKLLDQNLPDLFRPGMPLFFYGLKWNIKPLIWRGSNLSFWCPYERSKIAFVINRQKRSSSIDIARCAYLRLL